MNPSHTKTLKKYLDALHQQALECPQRPYMGYREICGKTETSTRTFSNCLPDLVKAGAVRGISVGKRTKYCITEEGEKRRSELGRSIEHARDYREMLMSSRSSFFVVDDPNPLAGATVYYELGLDKKGIDEIRERFSNLLWWLQQRYPDTRIRALMTSNPSRRNSISIYSYTENNK